MELSYIIVAAGRDLDQPCDRRRLHLCAQTGSSVDFLAAPPDRSGDILGICDGGVCGDIHTLCETLCTEAEPCGAIYADLERRELTGLIAALDTEAHHRDITCYVPLCMADAAPHSILTVSTAISGGSLRHYFSGLMQRYGEKRIAAVLERTCMRFRLPTDQPDGEPLEEEARLRLLHEQGSMTFFSAELCANYFTCEQDGESYFVLYDDRSTFLRKLELLDDLGVQDRFILYPDAEEFGL
ncbi:MAG: hypothetical protein ACI4PQ_00710 [Butyricicoccaceae bacterium]